MADQVLKAVIELEGQIEQQLQTEQKRAAAWLAGVRLELEQSARHQRQERAEKYRQVQQASECRLEAEAEKLLQCEMNYCQFLEAIDEQRLTEVLKRQLVTILPRYVDDHQDG